MSKSRAVTEIIAGNYSEGRNTWMITSGLKGGCHVIKLITLESSKEVSSQTLIRVATPRLKGCFQFLTPEVRREHFVCLSGNACARCDFRYYFRRVTLAVLTKWRQRCIWTAIRITAHFNAYYTCAYGVCFTFFFVLVVHSSLHNLRLGYNHVVTSSIGPSCGTAKQKGGVDRPDLSLTLLLV